MTINSKKTVEFDFSQLNPNIVYSAHNLELGSEDAYDRVLNGQHRDIVKDAFNAMLQASTELKQKPKDIKLDISLYIYMCIARTNSWSQN